MIHRGNRGVGRRNRARALLCHFKEEHPDAARGLGCRAGSLPRQCRAGGRIAAFGISDRLRLQRQPIEPAVHFRNIAGAKTDAGQPLALPGNDRANPIRGHAETFRRHQLQGHVVKCEKHAVGAVA